jgi:hypothetical protein
MKKGTEKPAFTTHGRVYILWRDLALNSDRRSKWLCDELMITTFEVETEMEKDEGAIFFSTQPAIQIQLSKGEWFDGHFITASDDPGFAMHLQLSFRSYGDTREEVFRNMNRVFKNIWTAAQKTVEKWDQLPE